MRTKLIVKMFLDTPAGGGAMAAVRKIAFGGAK